MSNTQVQRSKGGPGDKEVEASSMSLVLGMGLVGTERGKSKPTSSTLGDSEAAQARIRAEAGRTAGAAAVRALGSAGEEGREEEGKVRAGK